MSVGAADFEERGPVLRWGSERVGVLRVWSKVRATVGVGRGTGGARPNVVQ